MAPGAVGARIAAPGAGVLAPEEADPWSPIGGIVRSVDRQLESVRSVFEGGVRTVADPGVVESRRAAADVAARCAEVANAPGSPFELVELTRCLASVSALALMLLPTAVAPEAGAAQASDGGHEGVDDIVVVLGDAVTERFRLLANACTNGAESWPSGEFALPVEIFLRQLAAHDPADAPDPGSWPLAALWAGIALKVAEAALWWKGAPPVDQSSMGAPG